MLETPPECLRIDLRASRFQNFQKTMVWKRPIPNPVYAPGNLFRVLDQFLDEVTGTGTIYRR